MNSNNLYYLMSLAAFIATLWFQGRREKREGVDKAAAQLASAQVATIAAQAERIALLEKENTDQAEKLERYEQRIEYLEEVLNIRGNPKMVSQRSSTRP